MQAVLFIGQLAVGQLVAAGDPLLIFNNITIHRGEETGVGVSITIFYEVWIRVWTVVASLLTTTFTKSQISVQV